MSEDLDVTVEATSSSIPAKNPKRAGIYDFPLLFWHYARDKNTSEKLRQNLALAIAEKRLRPHLTEPAAIAAYEASQDYARGHIEKKTLLAARRALVRRTKEIESRNDIAGSIKCFTCTTYFATLFPIKGSELDALVRMTINAITNKTCEADRSGDWKEIDRQTHDDEYHEMAKILLELLPTKTVEGWKRSQTSRHCFDDPRFAKPYLEDLTLHLEERKTPEIDLIRQMFGAFQKCQGAETIEARTIAPIIRALSCKRSATRKIAIEFLAALAPWSETARNALIRALDDASALVRFEIVSIVGFYQTSHSTEFLVEFFAKAIGDRSKKVRIFAAQGADCSGCKELVDVLERAAAIEQDPEVKLAIQTDMGTLRDGHAVRDDFGSDDVQIVVKLKNGSTSKRVKRSTIAKMTDADLQELAASVRKDHGYANEW